MPQLIKPNKSSPINRTAEPFNLVSLGLLLVAVIFAGLNSLRWTFITGPTASLGPPGYEVSLAQATIAVIILAAFIFFLGQTIGPASWRLAGSILIPAAVLIAAMLVSCIFASDTRAALNATAGMIGSLGCLLLAWQLLDQPWKLKLAAAALIATAIAFAAKCWILQLYELDASWQQYLQIRQELWAQVGKDLDDPIVKVFETRLKGKDITGFFFHGNLAGSYLMMMTFLAVAVTWDKFSGTARKYRRLWAGGSLLLAGLLLASLLLTSSKGAILAGAVSALVAIVLLKYGHSMARRFKLFFAAAVILTALGAATVITYGSLRGTLPTRSMEFRWQYWQASARMFLANPLTGVGPANFRHAYLKYKLPQAQEQVSNPHNFIVQSFCQAGLFGGLAMMGLVGAILWNLARPKNNMIRRAHTVEPGTISVWLIFLAVAVLPLKFILTAQQMQNVLFALADLLPYIFCWVTAFLVVALHGDRLDRFADDAAAPLLVNRGADIWLAAAVLGFILGNLVNFSLFEPGTALTFFFITAMALSSRNVGRYINPGRKTAVLACLVTAVVGILHLAWVLRPTFIGQRAIEAANSPISTSGQYDLDPTYKQLLAASKCDPFNAQLPILAAQRLMAYALILPAEAQGPPLHQARRLINQAIRKHPENYALFVTDSKLYAMLSSIEPDRQLNHALGSLSTMRQAVDLNPTSRRLRIDYAKTLLRVAQTKLGRDDTKFSLYYEPVTWRRGAVEQLHQAIKLNDALPAKSLRRLPTRQITWINKQLLQLEQLQATSQPTR